MYVGLQYINQANQSFFINDYMKKIIQKKFVRRLVGGGCIPDILPPKSVLDFISSQNILFSHYPP
jgi:hypothetical protein